MFGMRGPELLLIAGVVVLLFGASRLPTLGKAFGEGLKNFRNGLSSGNENAPSGDDR